MLCHLRTVRQLWGMKTPNTGPSMTAEEAQRSLDALTSKSTSRPVVSQEAGPSTQQGKAHTGVQLASEPIRFDQETLEAEDHRLRQIELARERNRLLAFGLVAGTIMLFVTGAFLHRNSHRRRNTRLVYELDDIGRQNQNVLEQSFNYLARSQAIWRMLAESPTYDWKRNAGASSLVRRTRVAVRSSTPARVVTNVSVSCIDLGESKL